MTLRQLLRSLAADEAARDELMSDPGAVLERAGFEGLDEALLGTALVHHVDTATVDELDALVPLLERFAPIPGLVRAISEPDASTEPEPSVDPLVEADADPGRFLEDLEPDDASDGYSADAGDDAASTGVVRDVIDEMLDDAPDAAFGTGAVPIITPDAPPPADLSPLADVPPPADVPPSAEFDVGRPHIDEDAAAADPTVAEDLDLLD